jgi:hypothetical protein
MMTGVPDVKYVTNKREMWGIKYGHVFTVVGIAEYNGERLVKTRDPKGWGQEGYFGPWSDRDRSKWTDAARKALNHKNERDGTFWMPLDDWKQRWRGVAISDYRDEWKRAHKMTAWDRAKTPWN